MKLKIAEIVDRNFAYASASYKEFAQDKDRCRACSQYNHYKQVSQSEGNAADPIFMFVGEAPGREESEQARPFVGQAGQILRAQLKRHEDIFNRKTTLISNVLACRPLNNKFPVGQDPGVCFDKWLDREIKLVKPKIIVCLGNQSLRLVRNQTGITRQRGTWLYLEQYGALSFATFHPSYVMRCQRAKNDEVQQLFEQDFSSLADECKSQILRRSI